MDIDSMLQEELDSLSARISSADDILSDFSVLMSSITSIKEKLDNSKLQASQNNYLLAYKTMIDSLAELLQINSHILAKLILLKSTPSNTSTSY